MKALTRDEWVQRTIATRMHPTNFAKNPDKYTAAFVREYARLQLHNAVQRGDLLKPSNCSECGCSPRSSRELHAHHADYDQPLNVQWLCAECHYDKHRTPTRRVWVVSPNGTITRIHG